MKLKINSKFDWLVIENESVQIWFALIFGFHLKLRISSYTTKQISCRQCYVEIMSLFCKRREH